MTSPTAEVPEWDQADRMRKALRGSGLGVQEMADYLGVARNTVSTWLSGRIQPSVQTQRLWALRTGVPFAWLMTGRADADLEDVLRRTPRTVSNKRNYLTLCAA